MPSRVPEWQSGSRTPVPGGAGGRTPAWAGAGGSRSKLDNVVYLVLC